MSEALGLAGGGDAAREAKNILQEFFNLTLGSLTGADLFKIMGTYLSSEVDGWGQEVDEQMLRYGYIGLLPPAWGFAASSYTPYKF